MSANTPKYTFVIPRAILKAMALFQSADATRHILNSTRFEIKKGYYLTLIATDGRRLAVHSSAIEIEHGLGDIPKTAEFSINLSGISKLPAKAGGPLGPKYLTIAIYEHHADIIAGEYVYSAKFISGAPGDKDADGKPLSNFPAWRQIIPETAPTPVSLIALNPTLISSFGRAAQILSPSHGGLVCRGYKDGEYFSVQIIGCREFLGIIMPIKIDGSECLLSPAYIAELRQPLISTAHAELTPTT